VSGSAVYQSSQYPAGTEKVSEVFPDWPLTVTRVASPGLPGNAEAGGGVGVGVIMGVIAEVGSGVGTPETTGWFVVTGLTGLPEVVCCVHPVTRMKKIGAITKSSGIFIL